MWLVAVVISVCVGIILQGFVLAVPDRKEYRDELPRK